MFYYATEYKLNSYIFDILIAPWRYKLAPNSAMIASILVQAYLRSPFTFLLIFAGIILEYSANGLQQSKVFHTSFLTIYCFSFERVLSLLLWRELLWLHGTARSKRCRRCLAPYILRDQSRFVTYGPVIEFNTSSLSPVPKSFQPFRQRFFPCFFAKTYR